MGGLSEEVPFELRPKHGEGMSLGEIDLNFKKWKCKSTRRKHNAFLYNLEVVKIFLWLKIKKRKRKDWYVWLHNNLKFLHGEKRNE